VEVERQARSTRGGRCTRRARDERVERRRELVLLSSIDPESSTTKRTSAVDMSEIATRSVPGWMTHWFTGLKL
jgi:hypothetical protein